MRVADVAYAGLDRMRLAHRGFEFLLVPQTSFTIHAYKVIPDLRVDVLLAHVPVAAPGRLPLERAERAVPGVEYVDINLVRNQRLARTRHRQIRTIDVAS